jgi:hypothetical protein
MKLQFSISGLDGSGKSTQANYFKEKNSLVDIVDSLSEYASWPKLNAKNLFNWWFREGKTEDVLTTIDSCLDERRKDVVNKDQPFILIVRSDVMYEAVKFATLSTREKIPASELLDQVSKTKSEEVSIFLNISSENQKLRFKNKENTFSDEENAIYESYQSKLRYLLQKQIEHGVYDFVVDGNLPPEVVGNKIQDLFLGSAISTLDFDSLEKAIALGGLSESGKSKVGNFLSQNHNYQRLKIKYFMGQINEKYKLLNSSFDVYALAPDVQALLFTDEFLKYTKAHYYQGSFSLESLHGLEFTKGLEKALGNKIDIWYIDCPFQKRVKRNASELRISDDDSVSKTQKKDLMKKKRGAHQVKQIATVIDNSKDWFFTRQQINNLIINQDYKIDLSYNLPQPHDSALNDILNQITLLDNNVVKLLTLSGSGLTENIQKDWSDLDLIIVYDHNSEEIIPFLQDLTKQEVKVGITAFSVYEFERGLVDSKTKYHLNYALNHKLIAPICEPGIKIPKFSKNDVIKAQKQSITSAMHKYRRLLYDPQSSAKDIIKLAFTLMKFSNSQSESLTYGYDQTYSEFYKKNPEAPRIPFNISNKKIITPEFYNLVDYLASHWGI